MKPAIKPLVALACALGIAAAPSALADPALDAVLTWAASSGCEKYQLYENSCDGVCACDFWGHCLCSGSYSSNKVDVYSCAVPHAYRCTSYSSCPVEGDPSNTYCLPYTPQSVPLSQCLEVCQ